MSSFLRAISSARNHAVLQTRRTAASLACANQERLRLKCSKAAWKTFATASDSHFPPRSYEINRLRDSRSEVRPERKAMMLSTDQIHRFVMGVDSQPRAMTKEETSKLLQDPFAELILKMGKFPLSLSALLKALEETRGKSPGLEKYVVHHIAEGGQILWSNETAKLNRTFRIALAIDMRSKTGSVNSDIFISTGTQVDSSTQFLQLKSWDPNNLGFNFYQRLHSTWFWAGNSVHALNTQTRGRGPFSGHINGGPVMKELKLPWNHWHSMNAQISEASFAPNDPFLKSPLFNDPSIVEGAEIFERTIRAATHRWNAARMKMEIVQNNVSSPLLMLRQLLDTTNLNLTSSSVASQTVTAATAVDLPSTFFVNLDAFLAIGLSPNITALTVPGSIYQTSLQKFGVALVSKDFKQEGDTFFQFLVPEPALDDVDLLKQMLNKEVISNRLAACLLMIDFTNPIFSNRRKGLLQYVPKEIVAGSNGQQLDQEFVKAVKASTQGTINGSPEKEFLDLWSVPEDEWVKVFQGRIESYFTALQARLNTQESFDDVMRLAESRRFLFRKFALFEFPLTFATSNLSADQFPLVMRPDGTIAKGENVVIDNQGSME
jgi:hypothetical protein